MSLQSFLRGEGIAASRPRANGSDKDHWALEVSASGGPESDRRWWTAERIAPLPSARDTLELFDDLVASPTWRVQEGDLGRVWADGLVVRFFVWAFDRAQTDMLRAVIVPSPGLMPLPPEALGSELEAYGSDWAALWKEWPASLREPSAAQSRMMYLWSLGLSHERLRAALLRCVRAEMHHVPAGQTQIDAWLGVAERGQRGRATTRELVQACDDANDAVGQFAARDGNSRDQELQEETHMAHAVSRLLWVLTYDDEDARKGHLDDYRECLNALERAAARWRRVADRTQGPRPVVPCGGRPDLDGMLCAEIPFTEAMLALAAQTQVHLDAGRAPSSGRAP